MRIHKQLQIVQVQLLKTLQQVRERQVTVEEKELIGYATEDRLIHVHQKSWIVKVILQY